MKNRETVQKEHGNELPSTLWHAFQMRLFIKRFRNKRRNTLILTVFQKYIAHVLYALYKYNQILLKIEAAPSFVLLQQHEVES